MTSSMTRIAKPVPLSPLRSGFLAWLNGYYERTLHEHLIVRLRHYQSEYNRSLYPSPFEIVILDAEIICVPNDDFLNYWERQREDPTDDSGVRYMSAIELRELLRDLAQIEMEDQEATHHMREVIEWQEQQDAEEFAGVLSGQERALSTNVRPARQRCRPQVPFPWMPGLGYTAIVSQTLVEVFQLSMPFLDLIGVDTTALTLEWARNPIAVMGGVGSALVATTGLTLVWHLLISLTVELAGWEKRGLLWSGAKLVRLCFLSVFLLVGTVAIANLRHGSAVGIGEFQAAQLGQYAGPRSGSLVYVFMTFLLPAFSAYLHHKISLSAYWKQRRDIQALQARWDRIEEEKRQAGERRARARQLLLKKRARLEQELALLRARRMAIAGRVRAAQKEWLDMLDAACLASVIHARSLLAALEQDKISYLRAAPRPQALPLVSEEAVCRPQPEARSVWQIVRRSLTDNRPKDES
jgi:hypothetical protein